MTTYTMTGVDAREAEQAAHELFRNAPPTREPAAADRRISWGARSLDVPAHVADAVAAQAAERLAAVHGVAVLWSGDRMLRTAVAEPVARATAEMPVLPGDPALRVVGGVPMRQGARQALAGGGSTLEVLRSRRAAEGGL